MQMTISSNSFVEQSKKPYSSIFMKNKIHETHLKIFSGENIMARTGLEEVVSLTDPLQSWNYDFIVPNLPGGGDGRGLMIKAQTIALPGSQVEQLMVPLHGAEINYAGRRIWTRTFEATFLETRDTSSRDAINRWQDLARNVRLNEGTFKSEYATTGDMVLYDDAGNIVRTIRLFGLFPTNLADVTMDGSAGTAVSISVTFSYDFTEEIT